MDWEFRREEDLPDELAGMRERVILSYHNFQETTTGQHTGILVQRDGCHQGWDGKGGYSGPEMEDNLSLLNLIGQGRKQGVKVVAFCLGSLGRISRVACLLVGGAFTYAALNVVLRLAPGQFTLRRCTNFWKCYNDRRSDLICCYFRESNSA